jgi:hypothetical protein
VRAVYWSNGGLKKKALKRYVHYVHLFMYKSDLFGLLDEYKRMQERVAQSVSKEVTILKRKLDPSPDQDETGDSKKLKKQDQDHQPTENVICMHAKYLK